MQTRLRIVIILWFACCGAYVGAAEEPAPPPGPGPAEVPEPPPLPPESLEQETEEQIKPDVTIIRKKDRIIEEYRIRGRLYMVRVLPKYGKPYYILYPEDGHPVRGDLDDIKTPYWNLFTW